MHQFFLNENGAPQTIKGVEKFLKDNGIKVGKRDIQRDLADMKNAGFLESSGNRQNLKYELSANQPVSQFEYINLQNLRPEVLSTIITAISQRRELEIAYTDELLPNREPIILKPLALIACKFKLHLLYHEPNSPRSSSKLIKIAPIKIAQIRDVLKKNF